MKNSTSGDTQKHMSAKPAGLLRTVHHRLVSPFEKGAIRLGVRSCRDLSLPDFLGIGAQKSATRWLDSNLRVHPQVYLPHEGELHYFDRDFQMPLHWYASKFEGGQEKLKGDITPGYGPLPPKRIRFIRTLIPDVRLVLLLRNPVDRAWSHAVMRLVTLRNRAFEDVSEREFLRLFDAPVLTKRGDYLSILNAWERAFSREQLYVGFYEDVIANPRLLLTEVMEHLGLSTNLDWDEFPIQQVVHKGRGIPLPDMYRKVLE